MILSAVTEHRDGRRPFARIVSVSPLPADCPKRNGTEEAGSSSVLLDTQECIDRLLDVLV